MDLNERERNGRGMGKEKIAVTEERKAKKKRKTPWADSGLGAAIYGYVYTPPNCYKNSLSYSGAILWNSLPYGVRQAISLGQFKGLVKKQVL